MRKLLNSIRTHLASIQIMFVLVGVVIGLSADVMFWTVFGTTCASVVWDWFTPVPDEGQ